MADELAAALSGMNIGSQNTGSSKKSSRKIVATGVNKQGNEWGRYNDGAFRYKNKDDNGKTKSTYYNDGKGCGFYRNPKENINVYKNKNNGKMTVTPIKGENAGNGR